MGAVAAALPLVVLYLAAAAVLVLFARRPGGLACPRDADPRRLTPAQRLAILEHRRDDVAREIAALTTARPRVSGGPGRPLADEEVIQ